MELDRKCPSCGATMTFEPGFNNLVCKTCGHKEVIPELVSKIPVEELDFLTAQNTASHDWGMEAKLVQCRQCGAVTVQNKLQLSGVCPFCGSNAIDSADPEKDIMAPTGIIPFEISEKRALYIFNDWIKDRYLAPELLAKNAQLNKFYGIYIPLFTFDVLTVNSYTGQYTENNRTLFKSGRFQYQVDDFPVVASKQLSSDKLLWNVVKDYRTREAKPYTPAALSGFPCEHYSIGLHEAWNSVGPEMTFLLKQQVNRMDSSHYIRRIELGTEYYNLRYKYLIVPVWLNSFFYDNRLYMVVINGQTGKIDGQWPKSFGTFAKKAASFFLKCYGIDLDS